MTAALTAARAGAGVIVADENAEAGGALLCEEARVGGRTRARLRRAMLAELAALPNVRLMARTTVFGWYDDMVFGALERVRPTKPGLATEAPRERLWRIVARRAILASGAEQRPLVFAGNDRPGVMMAEAALAYARRYGVAIGRKVAVVASSNAGVRVGCRADARLESM